MHTIGVLFEIKFIGCRIVTNLTLDICGFGFAAILTLLKVKVKGQSKMSDLYFLGSLGAKLFSEHFV
jgi:hypothetical protein